MTELNNAIKARWAQDEHKKTPPKKEFEKEEKVLAAIAEFETMVRQNKADMVTIVTFKGNDPRARRVRHLKLS